MQINPLLAFLSRSSQEGWILERFVNIMMYGDIVDYVDNVDFYGLFDTIAQYKIGDIRNMQELLEQEIMFDKFVILWVDEFYISASKRYFSNHFVHPLIIYEYDKDKKKFKSIFFDIMRGQVIVDIDANELVKAAYEIRNHYMQGGSIDALHKTFTTIKPKVSFQGDFHPDLFIKNLSHYISCEKECEWYSSPRGELYNNPNICYGIQIYQMLLDKLNSSECSLSYKTIHDFIKHKKHLHDRLLYIENEYNLEPLLHELIDKFGKVADDLEKIRLLNMKYQTKSGRFPSVLCQDDEYRCKLKKALEHGYSVELDVLPHILYKLKSLTYSKKELNNQFILSYQIKLDNETNTHNNDKFDQQIIVNPEVYSCKIDFINGMDDYPCHDVVMIVNDKYVYNIKTDLEQYRVLKSISIPPMIIRKIECQSMTPVEFTVNVIPLPGQDVSKSVYDPELCEIFDNVHQMESAKSINRELNFIITDEDPYLFKLGYGINANHFKNIFIEMKITGTSNKAQIFFTSVASSIWRNDWMVEFETLPDGEFHTYRIDMSTNTNWFGYVGGIRFDPADYNGDCPFIENEDYECTIKKFYFKADDLP